MECCSVTQKLILKLEKVFKFITRYVGFEKNTFSFFKANGYLITAETEGRNCRGVWSVWKASKGK